MVKNIFVRVVSAILILLAMVLMDKYFSTGLIVSKVNAQNYAISPVNSKYALQNGTIANQSITTFTFPNLPGTTFYGYTGTASGGYWSYAQYGINLSTITKKGYYNIDYLFYNNWQGALLSQYTFSVFTNGAFTTCTANDSNANLGNNEIVKNIISVKCTDVYIDSSQTDALFVNIYPNNAKSYLDTIGITKVTFSYLPINDQTGILEQQERTNDLIEDETSPNTNDVLNIDNGSFSNSPVSDLITMPITLLQAINNNSSGACSTWNLGSLLGHTLTLPCINLSNILGSNLYNLIDMAICLFLAYNIGLLCITIYNNLISLKDDFDDMYTPQHTYKPQHGGDS